MSLNDPIISNALRKRLEEAGYTSLEELKKRSIIQLTQDIDLTEDEVPIIASLIHDKDDLRDGTAAITLAQEQRQGITTSCQRLDQLLSPTIGIPKCGITELSGGPGSGKTQLCIQLALNVQRPLAKGGLDGECIYIDTVGGLMLERFYQVAQANKNLDEDQIQLQLKHITYFRVLELAEMIALVRQLSVILRESPKVKLLIVDSVAYHLRLNIRENRVRIGMVNFIGQTLVQIANQFNLAIVVTNCISMDRTFSSWRPALGDSWAQWCTHRLMLTRKRQQRYATIYNAPQQTSKTMAPFCITEAGIEDVDMETLEQLYQWQEFESEQVKDPSLEHLEETQPTKWVNEEDEEDIWDEQGGFTDELLSEIPSCLSFDESMMEEEEEEEEEEEQKYTLVPDSQPDYSYMDHLRQELEDDMIDTSVDPPVSLNDGHSRQKRSTTTSPMNSTHKRSRQMNKKDHKSNPKSTTEDSKEHHQSDDDWGPDSDELWLTIAGMSSPSYLN